MVDENARETLGKNGTKLIFYFFLLFPLRLPDNILYQKDVLTLDVKFQSLANWVHIWIILCLAFYSDVAFPSFCLEGVAEFLALTLADHFTRVHVDNFHLRRWISISAAFGVHSVA